MSVTNIDEQYGETSTFGSVLRELAYNSQCGNNVTISGNSVRAEDFCSSRAFRNTVKLVSNRYWVKVKVK